MKLSERIKKLREISLDAGEKISGERARLITEFYKSDESRELSSPLKRAKAFEFLLKNKKIYIGEGELIVGERGPSPKEAPTYPEISLHSLHDLEILSSSGKYRLRSMKKLKSYIKRK